MLGTRKPQRTLFEAQCWPHQVPEDSFYARMGAVNGALFLDEDPAGMYCEDNGRPSWPPSLMNGIMVLQFHDDVGDDEAIERVCYDLRWKVALNVPLDFVPPHPSSMSVYRRRLLDHGQERYAFNRFVQVGRAAGFLPDKVTLLLDTTPQHGAGAVQDTYTLIRRGIRKVLKAAGYSVPNKRRGLTANLTAYLDSDRKADIDWSDPAARAAQLKVLVQDAEATLELVEQTDDPDVRSIAWLLAKILGDDVTTDEEDEPKLGEGVAEDRMVSLTDPEMRHGRKSMKPLLVRQSKMPRADPRCCSGLSAASVRPARCLSVVCAARPKGDRYTRISTNPCYKQPASASGRRSSSGHTSYAQRSNVRSLSWCSTVFARPGTSGRLRTVCKASGPALRSTSNAYSRCSKAT